MVLNSLQEQSHVASLLGYSSPGELNAGLPPTTTANATAIAAHSPDQLPPSANSPDQLHLAEVLLKTLLLSIGFYTVRRVQSV